MMFLLGDVILVQKAGLCFVRLVADGPVDFSGRVARVQQRCIVVKLPQLSLSRI